MNVTMKVPEQITEEQGEAEIIPFPRKHRPGSKLPHELLRNQRCIICGTYGCVIKYITPPEKMGEPTGDNLLPICEDHARIPLKFLYQAHPAVHAWLEDHERIDAILQIAHSLRKKITSGETQ